MWIYEQVYGRLTRNGIVLAKGYSGAGEHKNDPAAQAIHEVGPIPAGDYIVDPPHDSPELGPFALELVPDPANQMFGRSGFFIHGDSIETPGCASHGCIVMPRFARERIWESGDRYLRVVAMISEDALWPNG